MKAFLLKLAAFSFSFILLLLMLVVLSSLEVKQKTNIFLNPKVNKIILGHSYSETAFNDNMISGLKNCSESGESYFYNYQKLKIILRSNTQIDTVFVNFSNNQVFSDMDDWIWGDKYMNYNLTKYQPWCNMEDLMVFVNNNFFTFSQTQSTVIKNNIKKILKNNYSDPLLVGGYKPIVNRSNKKENNNVSAENTYEISETNIFYLKKIVEFCKVQKIVVIFIRPPVNEINLKQPVEVEFQKIRTKYFSKIEFWDFVKLPMNKELHFFDNTHVNKDGSTIVTSALKDKIRR
jgi:hypothetical protein